MSTPECPRRPATSSGFCVIFSSSPSSAHWCDHASVISGSIIWRSIFPASLQERLISPFDDRYNTGSSFFHPPASGISRGAGKKAPGWGEARRPGLSSRWRTCRHCSTRPCSTSNNVSSHRIQRRDRGLSIPPGRSSCRRCARPVPGRSPAKCPAPARCALERVRRHHRDIGVK